MRGRVAMIAAAAAALLLLGVGMPFCGTETEWASDKCMMGAPEGSRDMRVGGWSWWPLGTRCVLVDADGTRRESVVPPWRGGDWSDAR